MKKISLIIFFVILYMAHVFGQDYKYNIYIYRPKTLGMNKCFYVKDEEQLIATMNNGKSFIIVKTNSNNIKLKTLLGERWLYELYEKQEAQNSSVQFVPGNNFWADCVYTLKPSVSDYYFEISNKGALVMKTKADFDKYAEKMNCVGEYVWDNPHQEMIANNYQVQQPQYQQQQPQYIQSQPVVNQPVQAITPEVPLSDVDVNIPQTNSKSTNTFVLIIANEHYTFVDDVDCAIHDGEVFKEYCVKTLGVPERQVWFYKDASAGIISGGVDKMVQAMSLFENSKAIVYYCGHGIPDEHTGDAYIVPTDGKGTNTATCYSLNKLYTTLAASNATSVTYFMDACFSGANKEGSMLVAARGVAREPKKEKLGGNTVVFSAASGDETAMTFKEQGHGLFTYYLLKKLQETQGDVSYEDLDKYIKANIKRESFLTNEKVQTPTTNVSENAIESWKGMRLK